MATRSVRDCGTLAFYGGDDGGITLVLTDVNDTIVVDRSDPQYYMQSDQADPRGPSARSAVRCKSRSRCATRCTAAACGRRLRAQRLSHPVGDRHNGRARDKGKPLGDSENIFGVLDANGLTWASTANQDPDEPAAGLEVQGQSPATGCAWPPLQARRRMAGTAQLGRSAPTSSRRWAARRSDSGETRRAGDEPACSRRRCVEDPLEIRPAQHIVAACVLAYRIDELSGRFCMAPCLGLISVSRKDPRQEMVCVRQERAGTQPLGLREGRFDAGSCPGAIVLAQFCRRREQGKLQCVELQPEATRLRSKLHQISRRELWPAFLDIHPGDIQL